VEEDVEEDGAIGVGAVSSLKDALTHIACQFGEVMEWGFGKVLEVRPAENGRTNVTAFEPVILHFDGVFWKVPSWQLFLCVTPPPADAGAHTLFIHTPPLLDIMRIESPDLYAWCQGTRVAYYTPRHAYFGGTWMEFPLIAPHPHCPDIEVLLTHEYTEVPQGLQPVEMKVVESPISSTPEQDKVMLAAVSAYITDPRFTRHHVWQRGDIVLADNLGQLHGRSSFAAKVDRLLLRTHIGHPTEEQPPAESNAKRPKK